MNNTVLIIIGMYREIANLIFFDRKIFFLGRAVPAKSNKKNTGIK